VRRGLFHYPPLFALSGFGATGLALLQLCFSIPRIDFSFNNDAVHIFWEVFKIIGLSVFFLSQYPILATYWTHVENV
jgi:hypothetical protein